MGSYSQTHHGGHSRSRSRAGHSHSSHYPEDRHHGLKTSLQVIGMLICLRVLIPKMFPIEHDQDQDQRGYEEPPMGRGQGYARYPSGPPPPPYSRAQLQDTTERRRITYPPAPVPPPAAGGAYGAGNGGGSRRNERRLEYRDGEGSEWDGTTVHDSLSGSEGESERERRERRRRRRRERGER